MLWVLLEGLTGCEYHIMYFCAFIVDLQIDVFGSNSFVRITNFQNKVFNIVSLITTFMSKTSHLFYFTRNPNTKSISMVLGINLVGQIMDMTKRLQSYNGPICWLVSFHVVKNIWQSNSPWCRVLPSNLTQDYQAGSLLQLLWHQSSITLHEQITRGDLDSAP